MRQTTSQPAAQPSGIILILALLIVAATILAATIFSNLVIRSIQQSRLIDQSIQAYYLAESGAERALHQSRKREAIHDCALIGGGSCNALGRCTGAGFDAVPCITEDSGNLSVVANWQLQAAQEQSVEKYLQSGESFQVDLFHPYQETGGSGLAPVEVVQIVSPDLADFTLYGQLTNLTWLIGGTDDCPPGAPIIANDFITGSFNPSMNAWVATVSGLAGTDINQSCLYILRLSNPISEAVNGTFSITLHSSSPASPANQVSIPSRLLIESAATFGRSEQTVRVKTPVRPPLSGLYDFVLFSDTEIIKP